MTEMVMVTRGGGCAGKSSKSAAAEEHEKQQLREEQQQLSVIDFILSALRKSMVSTCRIERQDQEGITAVHHMEIGWTTNVQHITHVTFDRRIWVGRIDVGDAVEHLQPPLVPLDPQPRHGGDIVLEELHLLRQHQPPDQILHPLLKKLTAPPPPCRASSSSCRRRLRLRLKQRGEIEEREEREKREVGERERGANFVCK